MGTLIPLDASALGKILVSKKELPENEKPGRELTREENVKLIAKVLNITTKKVEVLISKGELTKYYDEHMREQDFLRKKMPQYLKQTRRDIGDLH